MDELPEFARNALEVLRQPLEDGEVHISRANASYTYPANVLLAASMNPCKCGWYGDPRHECTCTPPQISRYMSKISGPLLDRIDIHIEVPSVAYADLTSKKQEESSSTIRARVNKARRRQQERFAGTGIYSNSGMTPAQIRKYCPLAPEVQDVLKLAFDSLGLFCARARPDFKGGAHHCGLKRRRGHHGRPHWGGHSVPEPGQKVLGSVTNSCSI